MPGELIALASRKKSPRDKIGVVYQTAQLNTRGDDPYG